MGPAPGPHRGDAVFRRPERGGNRRGPCSFSHNRQTRVPACQSLALWRTQRAFQRVAMMTAERWAQIKDLFAVVVEKPVESRAPALADLCKGDDDLRSQVERLLARHDEMGGFLEGTSPKPAEEPPQMLQSGDTLADRYKIEKLLGSGGMGEVYAAQDTELGERIAVKVIRQETMFGSDVIDRLRREVQLARRVTHPNVCRVFDLGHHRQGEREIIFLTMELIGGETLTARLK